jgi:hypothetical protein
MIGKTSLSIVVVVAICTLANLANANTQWQVTDGNHDLLVGSNLVVQGSASSAGLTNSAQTFLTGIVSDTATGTQANYSPSGLAGASVIRESPASTLTITGIASPASGQFLIIAVAGTSASIVLSNEDATSTAANRIWSQDNSSLTITGNGTDPNGAALLWYDTTTSRWRVIATNQVAWTSAMALNGGANVTGGSLLISGSASHILAIGGTAPTVTSCGSTPSPSITGTDIAGKVTTGGTATACTITFGSTYTNAPACWLQPEGTATQPTYSTSATAINVTTDIATTTYDYGCISIGNGGT